MPEIYGGQPESFVIQAAAVVPIVGRAGSGAKTWLDYEHPLYCKMEPRWQHVHDFYSGEVADRACAKKYLVRRYQGEPDAAYAERLECSDYTPHLGTIIDTLAGMLFAVEDRASRVWSTETTTGALGDPNDAGSVSHVLWHDADGFGLGWPTLWRQFALQLITYQYMWVLVDTTGVRNDRHVVKLLPPMCVPNWTDDRLTVLMREATPRTSLDADNPGMESFIRWSVDGWQRFSKTKDGDVVAGASGVYTYQTRAGEPALPIFMVQLPLARYVGYILSRKAQVIFNQESVRDFGLRIANFAKLVLAVGSKEQYEQLLEKLLKGENVIPEDSTRATGHRYINPSSEPTTSFNEVLKEKREDIWVSGFKMYADAARQATATEIKQTVAGGVGAFLQLLKTAVDDAENGAFYRLEQATRAESPAAWGIARVERCDDFSSIDLNAILDQLRLRYVGTTGTIPIGRSALIQLAKDSARQDGLPVDTEEITAAVDTQILATVQKMLDGLGSTPPLVKARLTMRLVAALGLVDPKEMIDLEDGEKVSLLARLLTEAETMATTKQQADDLAAQLPPPGRF